MEARWVGMARPADLRRAGFRLAVGLGTVFALYYVGTVLGRTDPAVALPTSLALGLMATFGAPWTFRRLRL
jgi:hypothetical protein